MHLSRGVLIVMYTILSSFEYECIEVGQVKPVRLRFQFRNAAKYEAQRKRQLDGQCVIINFNFNQRIITIVRSTEPSVRKLHVTSSMSEEKESYSPVHGENTHYGNSHPPLTLGMMT